MYATMEFVKFDFAKCTFNLGVFISTTTNKNLQTYKTYKLTRVCVFRYIGRKEDGSEILLYY
ncbi:MAG TPA: hypothetical protein DIW30_00655 [Bacteroidales bacterium]|nr:hypothetical protein [Bacteroidales bacterium]